MLQCVTQIAARCAQRLKWSGKDDILALSSGNISIFLSICYEVWDVFLRVKERNVTGGQGESWYLAPILSVKYQIPEAHRKEPYYATVSEVKMWLHQAGVVIPGLDLENASIQRGRSGKQQNTTAQSAIRENSPLRTKISR